MQRGYRTRLERLEAAHRPPAQEWTIGVDIVANWRPDGGRQRVVAHIPPRLMEPGETFDYRRTLDELLDAMASVDDSLIDWGGDMIEEGHDDDEGL